MSVALVGTIVSWGVRGAVAGFACDLARSFVDTRLDLRNTAISAVHGVAIGIIGSFFGTGAALGAFVFSAFVVVPSLFAENFPGSNDRLEAGIKLRAIATLLGAAVGSIF